MLQLFDTICLHIMWCVLLGHILNFKTWLLWLRNGRTLCWNQFLWFLLLWQWTHTDCQINVPIAHRKQLLEPAAKVPSLNWTTYDMFVLLFCNIYLKRVLSAASASCTEDRWQTKTEGMAWKSSGLKSTQWLSSLSLLWHYCFQSYSGEV